MAPRPHWKGYLKLSLVSCPISLYPALAPAERISFRQVNRETGNRLRQQLVDTVTGELVETHKKGRGYEVGENEFVMIEDEELAEAEREARSRPFSPAPAAPTPAPTPPPPTPLPSGRRGHTLKLVAPVEDDDEEEEVAEPRPAPRALPRPIIENTRTIELDRFLERGEIDPRYYLAPYYVAPRDMVGQEAFAVIRDAMVDEGLVGMGRVVLSNRERPIVIEPMGRGLRAYTLHFAHEIRGEAEYFADIPPLELPDDVVAVSKMILNSKREPFDLAYLEDRYRTVLSEKLRVKQGPAAVSA